MSDIATRKHDRADFAKWGFAASLAPPVGVDAFTRRTEPDHDVARFVRRVEIDVRLGYQLSLGLTGGLELPGSL